MIAVSLILASSCSTTRKTIRLPGSHSSSQCYEDLEHLLREASIYVSPFEGRPYDHLYPIEGYQVYRLGWGAEANSYRVVSEEDHSITFTRKVFNMDETSDFYSEGTRDRELLRFSMMKELLAGCNGKVDCFKLIKIIGPKADDIIDFEYIPGQTLDAIIRDQSIPLKFRIEVKEQFEAFASNLIMKIKSRFNDHIISYRSSDWLSSPPEFNYQSHIIRIKSNQEMLDKGFEEETTIWIKPDNIILNTETGEFTLIDPY